MRNEGCGMWMWVCCLWMLDARRPGCRMMDAAAKTVGNRKLGARSDVRKSTDPSPRTRKGCMVVWLGVTIVEDPDIFQSASTYSQSTLSWCFVSVLPATVSASCYCQLQVEVLTQSLPQL
ncbi:hypothetical protein CABS01_09676 [Colletotrichum abscissum]|uniref:uncharacterized protein n=1 Tax=Colletotrichum abscissum TaxID=1671311 RepID=UPI0027D53A2F|nr:uncharacterized protein CABS01_09676 [Colletotrichum abscissum]KAK1501945.1 hypothetical protein CABS01_09676 [Colletotrichum abscissum]